MNLGQSTPLFVSINNGVFVCFKCSESHRSLGSSISLIRSISMDSWNEKQLQHVEMGGNKKFIEFLDAYKLRQDTIVGKYKSKAAEYYRRKVAQCNYP